MAKFSFPWVLQPNKLAPVVDPAKVVKLEDSLQESRSDLQLVEVQGKEELIRSASGTALASNDRVTIRVLALLEAHPNAYAGAAADLQALRQSQDGILLIQRARDALGSSASAATATVLVRAAERSQFTMEIVDKVVSQVEHLRATGQPVPRELGAVYDGVKPELERKQDRVADAQAEAARTRQALSEGAADSARVVELEGVVASLKAEMKRMAMASGQPAVILTPPDKAPDDRKSRR